MAKTRSKTKNNPVRANVSPRRGANPRTVAVVVAGLVVFGTAGLIFANASGELKNFAPETNLKSFPKSALVPSTLNQIRNSVPDVGESVYTWEPASAASTTDGTLNSYDPAPGENKHSLFKKLKNQKIRNVIDPDTGKIDPATVDPGTTTVVSHQFVGDRVDGPGGICYGIGTGRGSCYKWQNSGHPRPQVYFLDHTGSSWPVSTATYQWNQSYAIDTYYRAGSCPSITGIHCVNVYEGWYGQQVGWVGLTSIPVSGGYIRSGVFIELNDSFNSWYPNKVGMEHAEAACHEMGHALGLAHNTSTNSCLYSADLATISKPNGGDYDTLASMY